MLSHLEVVNNSVQFDAHAGGVQTISVSCPVGKLAIGGGGGIVRTSTVFKAHFWFSQPIGDPPTGWSVTGEMLDVEGIWRLSVWAVCATVAP